MSCPRAGGRQVSRQREWRTERRPSCRLGPPLLVTASRRVGDAVLTEVPVDEDDEAEDVSEEEQDGKDDEHDPERRHVQRICHNDTRVNRQQTLKPRSHRRVQSHASPV